MMALPRDVFNRRQFNKRQCTGLHDRRIKHLIPRKSAKNLNACLFIHEQTYNLFVPNKNYENQSPE